MTIKKIYEGSTKEAIPIITQLAEDSDLVRSFSKYPAITDVYHHNTLDLTIVAEESKKIGKSWITKIIAHGKEDNISKLEDMIGNKK